MYYTGSYLPRGLNPINHLGTSVFVLHLMGLFVNVTGNYVYTNFRQTRKGKTFSVNPLKFRLLFGFRIFFHFPNFQIKDNLGPRFATKKRAHFNLFWLLHDPLHFPPYLHRLIIFNLQQRLINNGFRLKEFFQLGTSTFYLRHLFLNFYDLVRALVMLISTLTYPTFILYPPEVPFYH